MNTTVTGRRMLLALLVAGTLATTGQAAFGEDATPPPGSESELAPQLPLVDLPTMNELGYTFELESTWQGDNDGVSQDLPIYTFESINYTEAEVASIAETLGVGGEVTSQGDGTYTVEGEGSIFTTPGLLQFVSAVEAPDEELPEDEAAIAFARDWLRVSGLLPANIGEGSIVARIEEPARLIVGFVPASPTPLLSSTPGLTVTVGPAGSILEARVSWADISEGETFRLRGVLDAFTVIESRQSYLDVSLPTDAFQPGSAITGAATYDQVSMAYTTSGSAGGAQYLQPVYVFTGTLRPEGTEGNFSITAYVPAIVTGLEPVG